MKAKKAKLDAVLPKKVTVLGTLFEVQICNLKGLDGDCSLSDRKIRIHQSQDVKAARATLFHETLHAALAISGLNELLEDKSSNLEEALVRCLEHAFADIVDIDKMAVR